MTPSGPPNSPNRTSPRPWPVRRCSRGKVGAGLDLAGGADMLKGRLALNASALMISSAATGLLGLVYWMVAERMLPTSEVGRARR